MGPDAEAEAIAAAFARIEDELLASMVRNFARHRAEELAEGFDWAQWQALQVQSLDAYARRNAKRYGPAFDRLNRRMDAALRRAFREGGADAEKEILQAVRHGWEPPSGAPGDNPGAPFGGSFFRVPEARLDALCGALSHDMEAAERAVLRKSRDAYRDAVFAAQVYATSGAGTYERAVDMATRDLLAKGIDCVTYRDGSEHSLREYSQMAVRTAVRRAQLAGDGAKRDEWGVHTVIVPNNGQGCPKCLPWSGRVLVDDVYSGGTAAEAEQLGYPLLSTAMAAGLLHPNCRDTLSTFFPGVSEEPKKPIRRDEIGSERRERIETAQRTDERNAGRYGRMSRLMLDEGNREHYAGLADKWESRKAAVGAKLKPEVAEFRVDEAKALEARIARRIEGAKTLFEKMHNLTVRQVADEASRFAARLEELRKVQNIWNSVDVYRRGYAAFVESLSTNAPITIEDFTKLDGNELQIAQWFSNMGVEVRLRNPNTYKDLPGGNTSDSEMFGTLFDYKRITSKNSKQIGTNIRRKLETQGPGFVVDITLSPMSLDDAVNMCANLLENEKIEQIIVIKDGKAIMLEK